MLSVSENTKFGNENKKELRSKLLMCQEELKVRKGKEGKGKGECFSFLFLT